MNKKFLISRLLPAAFALLFLLPASADETLTQTREERIPAAIGTVSFLNLAGEVALSRADGNEMRVKATFSASGDDEAEAREYLGLLDLKMERRGNAMEVVAVYPVDDYSRFAYSPRGRSWGFNSTTRYLGERISVSSSRGLRVHVDFEIAVPDGMKVRFENKVGDITASGINADLDFDTSSGSIAVSGGKGSLKADTGSGSVSIGEREGDVLADTGSGSIKVEDVVGKVTADTGSGSIRLERITGDIRADTGSGGVDMADIEGNVWVDTGSGSVDGIRLAKVRDLEIDTGSGSVELDGDFSGLERMRIDTGSGGVRMRTDGTLNMQLEVSAGSGGVRVDLPDMKNVVSRRGDFEADIGNAEGRGLIDTGSGGVRISSR